MGEMKVVVISSDTRKPSSPTPTDLRHLQLSFLDQIATPVFMPIILFYPTNPDVQVVERCHRLKESLSEALSRFYPLAGRIRDNVSVECNDEGVPYFEAKVNRQLADVLRHPDPAELNKFLPCELDDIRDLILAIQINVFECGGIAIGVCISHKVADALSLVMFVNSWAGAARGDGDVACPQFGMAGLFPPMNLSGFKPSTGITKEKIVTKRFVFSASNVAAIREKYADSTTVDFPRRPTRIEALSAFVWSRFAAATQGMSNPERVHTVLHAVNLRTRMDPPLPNNYFGNISRLAMAAPCMDGEGEGHGLVGQIREAISKINGDFVRKLQETGAEHLSLLKKRAECFSKGEMVSFSFTSLCRFPMQEADFGWGKPIWVGSASLLFKNLVVFMDTAVGGGIEAWVNLKEEDMVKLQEDKEFCSFVASPISDAK